MATLSPTGNNSVVFASSVQCWNTPAYFTLQPSGPNVTLYLVIQPSGWNSYICGKNNGSTATVPYMCPTLPLVCPGQKYGNCPSISGANPALECYWMVFSGEKYATSSGYPKALTGFPGGQSNFAFQVVWDTTNNVVEAFMFGWQVTTGFYIASQVNGSNALGVLGAVQNVSIDFSQLGPSVTAISTGKNILSSPLNPDNPKSDIPGGQTSVYFFVLAMVILGLATAGGIFGFVRGR